MKKLFLTAFLTAYLVMGGKGFAGVVASGSCAGDGTSTCAWTYDDTTHTLSITGSGVMADYGYTESSAERKQQYPNDTWVTTAPWKDYVDDIHEVSISQGITNIGQGFLTGAQGITHIDIPQGVTDIGYGAFMDVSAQSVSLPEGLTTIGGWAFSTGSPGITSINLPSTLTTIWNGALAGFRGNDILIPDGVSYIGEDVLIPYSDRSSKIYCQDTSAHTCSDLINSSTGGVGILKVYSYDSASGLYFVDGDGEYFGSTNDMLQGSDYSCGATTSICSTVLSEVGGANCDTIKSCRNLAEMADANVYCNSMSTCKELTDLVGGENCDSLESCKALSDMVASGEYCTTVEECKALNDMVGGENCDSLDSCKALSDMVGGEYCDSLESCKALSDMVGGEYCDSLESCKALSDMASSGEYCTTVAECKALNDMVGSENCDSLESCKALSDMAASGEYCTTVAECKRFMDLMNSGYCEGFAACKEMFNAGVINYNGKRYGSLEDLYNGNALPSITRQEQGDGSFAVYKDGVFVGYKGKRIYTMEEANRVTKPMGNTLKIKYR